MGFLDMFKRREEEPDNSALHSMKSSIKNAHTYISKFLDGTKEFQAARRHEEQYNNIKQRLVEMKIFLVEANTLVDKKIKNDITYQSDRLKNTEQLKKAIEMIIKELNGLRSLSHLYIILNHVQLVFLIIPNQLKILTGLKFIF